ncbi:hypothetical protein DH2020_038520 [Rehmannia glutinosa]|uniref:NB-ARC domain-containing protein n=1 Tax=Rehmannia glutinosa TaxID=99300 RepID=A0ABR0UZ33_REHGL
MRRRLRCGRRNRRIRYPGSGNQVKGYFFRAFMTPPRLLNIAERVETVCRKISDIYGGKDKIDFAGLGIGDGEPDKPELDVISIISMPGLGKTTLAGKIYRNPTIQYEFQTRAWVFVSQEFTVKDVFISILKQTNKELFANTKRVVEDKDTKSAGVDTKIDDWDRLQIALPKSSKMGKVLITSRQVEVARFANRDRPPHNVRFLTQEESWLLLWWEVFRKPECPSELEVLGKQIANNCKGVALAIVLIGGILARKSSSSDEMSARRNAWRKVSERVTTYLIYEDPQRLVEKLISLSYQKLPYHLRECFLYLGMFPEDYEIPVWKLITKGEVNLWDVGYPTIPNDEDEFNLPNENISAIPVAFKLKIKYFTFILLQALERIQTLIVHTMRHALDVEANILSMVQLRHFKTNTSTTLRKPGKNSKEGRKLQTLGIISPESCGGEVFDRACNLKKLGICGKLALLLDGKDVSFDSLAKLGNLEKLKLINFPYPHLASEAKMGCLPPAYKFPAKLRSLTLSYTYLDWSHMSILGSLETLEVLKLKNYAFVGDCWVVADVGFRCLEFLHIGRTNLALWVASSHHFSKLRRLELRNCEKLKEIPIGLADIPCLQLLDLYYTKQAAVSARKILEAKNKQEEKAFKLSILPPEDE